jgi:hypothetical protein
MGYRVSQLPTNVVSCDADDVGDKRNMSVYDLYPTPKPMSS